ncbi:hypothetical protein QQ045_000960 [Rhodiola kirilowii]
MATPLGCFIFCSLQHSQNPSYKVFQSGLTKGWLAQTPSIRKMWKVGYYLAVCSSVLGSILAVLAVYLAVRWKLRKQDLLKDSDLELRKLSLSIRTTSEKKISFDGSQGTYDGNNTLDKTPRKMLVEIYASQEIRKATDDFNRANLIQGNVYHSRLNGREVAIKIADRETHANVEFELFSDTTHCHQ